MYVWSKKVAIHYFVMELHLPTSRSRFFLFSFFFFHQIPLLEDKFRRNALVREFVWNFDRRYWDHWLCVFCRSREETKLFIAPVMTRLGVDTAESRPSKVCVWTPGLTSVEKREAESVEVRACLMKLNGAWSDTSTFSSRFGSAAGQITGMWDRKSELSPVPIWGDIFRCDFMWHVTFNEN